MKKLKTIIIGILVAILAMFSDQVQAQEVPFAFSFNLF